MSGAGGFHVLTVRDVRPEGDDAVAVSFDVPAALRDRFAFSAGQHLTLRGGPLHPGPPGGPEGTADLRRSYSICAAPGEPLRVGIRRVSGGAFSGWAHGALQPGCSIDAMPPDGRFGAALAAPRAAPLRHVLAVAGGSGITPILSIVRTALAARDGPRVTLLYANRAPASTMFKGELDDLKDRHLARFGLHFVYSRAGVESPLHGGRLDAERIARFLRLAGPVDEAFVCGPHAFNDGAEAALRGAGIAPARIHVERFGVPPDHAEHAAAVMSAPAPVAAAARIDVLRDGVTHRIAWEPGDGNLLGAAARAGLDVPYACRSGVCATCRAKLLDGQVDMARNFALDAADLAAGFVLTCQARPLSAQVSVSFDER